MWFYAKDSLATWCKGLAGSSGNPFVVSSPCDHSFKRVCFNELAALTGRFFHSSSSLLDLFTVD